MEEMRTLDVYSLPSMLLLSDGAPHSRELLLLFFLQLHRLAMLPKASTWWGKEEWWWGGSPSSFYIPWITDLAVPPWPDYYIIINIFYIIYKIFMNLVTVVLLSPKFTSPPFFLPPSIKIINYTRPAPSMILT